MLSFDSWCYLVLGLTLSFISSKLTDVEECDGASLFPTKGVHGQVSMLKAPVENFHLRFGVAEAV